MALLRFIDILAGMAKVLTGATGVWKNNIPSNKQRIYFANHTSNLDTIIIWTTLPNYLRDITRPVAAKDYWDQKGIRRHIATKELNVVFVERNAETRTEDPLNPLRRALDQGDSLIIFPEGKRNSGLLPQEFKSGIYRLHQEYPDVELIPVYLENVAKTFPRGAYFPLPIICKAFFGAPLNVDYQHYTSEENKKTIFLNSARQAVLNLVPDHVVANVDDFNKAVSEHMRPIVEEQLTPNN